MQIAAMAPQYLATSEVPADAKAKQSEIFDAQLADEGKPEKVRPKIIEGKLAKWMKEICLLEQSSVIETDKTIAAAGRRPRRRRRARQVRPLRARRRRREAPGRRLRGRGREDGRQLIPA